MSTPTTRERYRGSLLGLAAGDALGTSVEFHGPGTFPPLTDMVGGGVFALAPGEWTDDTSMALCLAESLVERRGFDPRDQLSRYLRWYRAGHLASNGRCFDIGATTRVALERFERNGERFPGRSEPEAAANGSLMRLAPAPLLYAASIEDAIHWSGESSRTTHGAARPVDACRYLGALIAAAVAGTPKHELLGEEFWRWGPLAAPVEEIARGSFRRRRPPEIRGSGYVVACLEAALWALHHSETFRDGALAAANLGEDADTTAAVYGQLAGAIYGAEAIPSEWRERLALRDVIVDFADGLHDLSSCGLPLGAAPPFPDSYWVQAGSLLAGEYPGHRDPDTARRKLAALLDAGITHVVDLTEAGEAGLLPYADLLAAEASSRGLTAEHRRMPIRDLDVPNEAEMRAILDHIDAATAAGGAAYVHCWGGVGRTGTVVGCHLARQGTVTGDRLPRLEALRAHTPKAVRRSPETSEQRAMVRGWGR